MNLFINWSFGIFEPKINGPPVLYGLLLFGGYLVLFKSLFKKKTESKDQMLIRIANEIIIKNSEEMVKYLKLEGVKFAYSLHSIEEKGYLGATDNEKHKGKWKIIMFYNNLYTDAMKIAKQKGIDTMLSYKICVARVFIHELTHVGQFNLLGSEYPILNVDVCEADAELSEITYGDLGLYRL